MNSLFRTKSQVFQLAVDVLISKSKDFIEVERIFDSKATNAGHTLKTAIKVCLCFKRSYEFTIEANKRLLNIEANGILLDKLFGPLDAFVSRCQDLLEICYTNHQFLSSFVDVQSSSASAGELEMHAVASKYNKLIGNIKDSGRKCLDVENDQLRNDFQNFKSEV